MELLSEAETYVQTNLSEGVICPCCKQYAKTYNRKLNSSMVIALLEIYKAHKKNGFEHFHVEDYFKSLPHLSSSIRGDFPKLRHWNLIHDKDEVRDDKSTRNGYYMISGLGIRFLRNQITVPSHMFIYNNEVIGVSDKLVTFKECLASKFNYEELMRGL